MRRDTTEFSYLEWEAPPFGVELCIRSAGVFLPGVDSVTIERDHRGALAFIAKGTAKPNQVREQAGRRNTKGTIYSLDNSLQVDWPGGTGSLRGIDTLTWQEGLLSRDLAEVELRGNVASFTSAYTEEPIETKTVVEWVVNLTDALRWPDETRTEIRSTRHSVRGSGPGQRPTRTEKDRVFTTFGRDHVSFFIRQLPGVTIQFGEVRDPDGSCTVRPGFISYSAAGGATPDVEMRDTIRRALGFMTGSELGLLGHTAFGEDGTLVEQYARHLSLLSGIDQLFQDCGLPPAPLADTDPEYGCYVDRSLFVRQVEGFVDAARDFDLPHILALYWYADAASPYTAAVLFGAVLEAIRADCTRKEQRESVQQGSGQKMRWKKARDRVKGAIRAFARAGELTPVEAVRLERGVDSIDEISQNDRWHGFFNALDLRTGAAEKRALKERNRPAHGVSYSRDDFPDAIRRVRELRTLCSRVLLRITNGSDTYVDFGTEGFPERRLEEPLLNDTRSSGT